jgi:hypothetical protein
MAGRSRGYQRIVIDQAAFAKDGRFDDGNLGKIHQAESL